MNKRRELISGYKKLGIKAYTLNNGVKIVWAPSNIRVHSYQEAWNMLNKISHARWKKAWKKTSNRKDRTFVRDAIKKEEFDALPKNQRAAETDRWSFD